MDEVLAYMLRTNDLQKTKRYGNYPPFIESTAEHSFKMVLMVDYFYKAFDLDIDYQKCVAMALYHDFGEFDLTQDVDIKEKRDAQVSQDKNAYEANKIAELSTLYPPIAVYFAEYRVRTTPEAKFVNAIDKLEAIIHPMTIGVPIMNHEIFANYADSAVQNFPLFIEFYRQIKMRLKEMYACWGFAWREEYDQVFKDSKKLAFEPLKKSSQNETHD